MTETETKTQPPPPKELPVEKRVELLEKRLDVLKAKFKSVVERSTAVVRRLKNQSIISTEDKEAQALAAELGTTFHPVVRRVVGASQRGARR